MTVNRRWASVVAMALGCALVVTAAPQAGAKKKKLPVETVACGDTIDHSLRVANNLPNCPDDGLIVGAADITIDLGGHRIDGTGGLDEVGIDNSAGHDGVAVRNGIVTGFETGVHLDGAEGNSLKALRVMDNTANGIFLTGSSENTTLKGNDASGNDGIGIVLDSSSGNTLKGNDASGNGGTGIFLSSSSDNTLKGNEASGNGGSGIFLSFSSDNTLKGNEATGNRLNGIVLNSSSGNTLKGNEASANDSAGISVTGGTGNTLKENAAHENGAHGITSNNTDLTLVANKANRNGFLGGGSGDDSGLGIDVPAGTTNAENKAKNNDDPRECIEVDVNCHVAP